MCPTVSIDCIVVVFWLPSWRRSTGISRYWQRTLNYIYILGFLSQVCALDRQLQSTSTSCETGLLKDRIGSREQSAGHHQLQRRTQWRRRTGRSCACSCSAFSAARLSRRRAATSPSAWTSCSALRLTSTALP
jgi:hypothetical protein